MHEKDGLGLPDLMENSMMPTNLFSCSSSSSFPVTPSIGGEMDKMRGRAQAFQGRNHLR